MKKKIPVAIVISLMVVALAFGGGGGQASGAASGGSGEVPVLKVAVQPFLVGLPTYYMMENGLDVKNGFKIERTTYASGVLINEALGANRWDLGTGGTSAVYGIANAGALVIANLDLCSGGINAYVRPNSKIAQIKDAVGKGFLGDAASLKGAKAILPVGTLNQLNVFKWLEKAGLGPDDVQFIHMDPPSAFQAFKAGEGDITAFSPPLTFNCEAEGWVSGASGENLGLDIWDPLLANPRTINEKNAQIVAYVKLMYEVFDLFMANPELCAEWSVKWQAVNGVTLTMENARREVKSRPFMTSAQAKTAPVGETIYEMAVFFNQIGNLEKDGLNNIRPNLRSDIIKKVF